MDGRDQRRVAAWQGLLVVGALSLLPIHLVDAGGAGFGIPRVGLGLVFLICASLMRTSWGQARGAVLFTGACFTTGAFILWLTVTRELDPNSSLLLLLSAITVGLIIPSLVARVVFLLGTLVGTAASFLVVETHGIDASVILTCLGVASAVVLVHGYYADRTAHEVGELSLVASRVHNGVALLDTKGRIEWVNASFVKLAGEPAPDLRGRRLVELLHGPDASEDALELLSEALRRGHQASVELPHRSALGTVTWVSVDLTPVRSPLGALQRFIAVETDVSRARAFMARVLDSMTDVLLVVQEGRGIRSANEAACQLLGIAEGELLGRPLQDFLDDSAEAGLAAEGASRVHMLLTRRMTPAPGSDFGDLDLQLRGADGAIPVRASAAVLADEPGQPRIIVIVARDVRDRLRLQQQRHVLDDKIRQGQKLESLGVLAGGIAHDFNNLLVGILGNASLAGLELEGHDAAGALVQRIERSAQRAADLTRQMLAYSGRGRFEIGRIQVPELVRDVSELIDASISKKAELKVEFDEGLPDVDGDPSQLRQVVMNLLTNASESLGSGGGVLTVRGRKVLLDADSIAGLMVASESMSVGEYFELSVSDSGHGMDGETVGRMFEPFYTTKATGRGLGLAATLGIVRGHGGGLNVESSPGEGTMVRVYLPPAKGEAMVVTPDDEDSGMWASQGAILVADDEPEVLDFIEAVLSRRGFEVLRARDGVECVEIYEEQRQRVSLVVLDMTMPRMNGKEALEAIRAVTPDIRVILSSGYDEQELAARLGDMSPAEFLQKPYRASQLTDLVKLMMGEGA
ncbi:MAG: response regulator [Proteobacteria bacterium]|nr:response regulator [Pseudomonadota bacterium]